MTAASPSTLESPRRNPGWVTRLDEPRQERLRKALTPKWSEYIPHQPHPKQHATLLLDNIREVLYGGAAGGGKSDYLLMAALQYVDVPGYSALILRRTFPQLSQAGGLIGRAYEWLGPHPGAYGIERTAGFPTRWTFPSGAQLAFGHCQRESDKENFQSGEYQFIGFDELTQFPLTIYLFLLSRLRRLEGYPVPLRVRSASNPGGDGHQWVKDRLVKNIERAPDRMFIPAKLSDNPSLDRKEYESTLMLLHPYDRQRLLKGDWDVRPPGSRFRREWFKIIEKRPADPGLVWRRRWDLASTEDEGNDPDWTVGTLWTRLPSGMFVCADMQRFRGSPATVEARVRQQAEIDGREVHIRLEQEPGSSGKFLVYHFIRQLAGWPVSGKASTGDKVRRSDPYASQAEAGNVCLVRGPWNEAFLGEHEVFPNGPHDDIVDTGSGAIEDFTRSGGEVTVR